MLNLEGKFAFTLVLLIVIISGCTNDNRVCVNEKCFKVEVVDSPEDRGIGLMKYDVLDADRGMWFIFENEGRHSIWMKNMMFPIDIIWVDNSYNVVDVKRNAEPCVEYCEVYSPSKDARYVLEVNINSNINIGDRMDVK